MQVKTQSWRKGGFPPFLKKQVLVSTSMTQFPQPWYVGLNSFQVVSSLHFKAKMINPPAVGLRSSFQRSRRSPYLGESCIFLLLKCLLPLRPQQRNIIELHVFFSKDRNRQFPIHISFFFFFKLFPHFFNLTAATSLPLHQSLHAQVRVT